MKGLQGLVDGEHYYDPISDDLNSSSYIGDPPSCFPFRAGAPEARLDAFHVVAPKGFKLTPAAFTLGRFGRRPFNECKNVRIDHFRMSGHHAVGEARINFQRGMPEQLGLQQGSVFVRHNLVIVALHHERRHRDRFEIVRLVCLRDALMPS